MVQRGVLFYLGQIVLVCVVQVILLLHPNMVIGYELQALLVVIADGFGGVYGVQVGERRECLVNSLAFLFKLNDKVLRMFGELVEGWVIPALASSIAAVVFLPLCSRCGDKTRHCAMRGLDMLFSCGSPLL